MTSFIFLILILLLFYQWSSHLCILQMLSKLLGLKIKNELVSLDPWNMSDIYNTLLISQWKLTSRYYSNIFCIVQFLLSCFCSTSDGQRITVKATKALEKKSAKIREKWSKINNSFILEFRITRNFTFNKINSIAYNENIKFQNYCFS